MPDFLSSTVWAIKFVDQITEDDKKWNWQEVIALDDMKSVLDEWEADMRLSYEKLRRAEK
ncbi:hypothetical protein IFT91_00545 [Pseudomonas fluorescens]|nr:hypothetical protein [Pseudomonas fluorescens]